MATGCIAGENGILGYLDFIVVVVLNLCSRYNYLRVTMDSADRTLNII